MVYHNTVAVAVVANPFRAPKPLPILIPGKFVEKNDFPVVKGR